MPRPDLPPVRETGALRRGSRWLQPFRDFLSRRRNRPVPFEEPRRRGGNRKRGRDLDDGGLPMPVEPNRPPNLSGGAAAALEFDD
jgi:hypothetical protein